MRTVKKLETSVEDLMRRVGNLEEEIEVCRVWRVRMESALKVQLMHFESRLTKVERELRR